MRMLIIRRRLFDKGCLRIEVEVEDDEFDDELERYAPKDDALVEDVDGLTSTVQFKPIEGNCQSRPRSTY